MTTLMHWDPKKWGTPSDRVHQSDMSTLSGGQFSCGEKWARRKDDIARTGERPTERVRGNTALGTADHEVIRRVLSAYGEMICAGELPKTIVMKRADGEGTERVPFKVAVGRAIKQELREATRIKRSDGSYECDDHGVAIERPIIWKYRQREVDEIAYHADLVVSMLEELHKYAVSIIATECTFELAVDVGWDEPVHCAGTKDLVYVPRSAPDTIAIADWKSGAMKIDEAVLDHGYQLGMYALAARDGVLTPSSGGDPFALDYGFPSELAIVHLRDYAPYKRASSKTVTRRSDARFFGVEPGVKIKRVKGDRKGPAWELSEIKQSEIGRFRASLRRIVSAVRAGHFAEHISDATCKHCPYRETCLVDGDDASAEGTRDLLTALDGFDTNTFDVDHVA